MTRNALDPLYDVYKYIDTLIQNGEEVELYIRQKDGIKEGTFKASEDVVEAWDCDDFFDVLDGLVSKMKSLRKEKVRIKPRT